MSDPVTRRSFVAIEVDPTLRGSLVRLQRRLEEQLPGLKLVAPDQLHMTLAFLGEVVEDRLDAIGEELTLTCAERSEMALDADTLGAFPDPARARVVWVGLSGADLPRLIELQASIADRLTRLDAPPTDDRFHPHVTLARARGGGRSGRRGPSRPPRLDCRGVFAAIGEVPPGHFLVREVTLITSELGPEGPTYTARNRCPLGRPST